MSQANAFLNKYVLIASLKRSEPLIALTGEIKERTLTHIKKFQIKIANDL